MDFLAVLTETAVSEAGWGTLAALPALAAAIVLGLRSLVKETGRRMRERPRAEMDAWNEAFRMMGLGKGWRFPVSVSPDRERADRRADQSVQSR